MRVDEILKKAVQVGASDTYFMVDAPITCKVRGKFANLTETKLNSDQLDKIVAGLYDLQAQSARGKFEDGAARAAKLLSSGDDDFAVLIDNAARFRVNVFRQKDALASVCRTILYGVPKPEAFNIPANVLAATRLMRGIVLVTGTTGSGKSTTLACMIDIINSTRENHIVTIEDPLEFMHTHKKSRITQREINRDTESYGVALRAVLRQAPDVILIGEMRDYETISAAITAAETGHLVFSTLHTMGAAPTIDRIIDVFPSNQQNQIRTQLASTLQSVICQQLVPTKDGKVFPAFEVMNVTQAVKTNIREGKVFQIPGIMQVSQSHGMQTMDMDLFNICAKGLITRDVALAHSIDSDALAERLKTGK